LFCYGYGMSKPQHHLKPVPPVMTPSECNDLCLAMYGIADIKNLSHVDRLAFYEFINERMTNGADFGRILGESQGMNIRVHPQRGYSR